MNGDLRLTNCSKKHVSDDLQPYTCYLQGFKRQNDIFGTFSTWKEHVFGEHRIARGWSCPFRQPPRMFEEEKTLTCHVRSSHMNIVFEEFFDNLPDLCRADDAPSLDTCYVCLLSESDWNHQRTNNPKLRPKEKSFLEHLAYCMHNFALRALPEPPSPTGGPTKVASHVSADFALDEVLSYPSASLDFSKVSASDERLKEDDLLPIISQIPEEFDFQSWNEEVPPGGDISFINAPDINDSSDSDDNSESGEESDLLQGTESIDLSEQAEPARSGSWAYVWDTFDTYRLRRADLEEFLTETFGNYEFYISVSISDV